VAPGVELAEIGWEDVVLDLRERGWTRIGRAVAPATSAALEDAAPGPWLPLPATEGDAGVRQAGLACHCAVDRAAAVVQSLASSVRARIDDAREAHVPRLPAFNHAQWCRAEDGEKFITPHRDPDSAVGVVAVLTIRGRARFRVWDVGASFAGARQRQVGATEWDTDDGDLVLLRGGGWPTAASHGPIHEVESPPGGERITLTLRSNAGGFGADYFA